MALAINEAIRTPMVAKTAFGQKLKVANTDPNDVRIEYEKLAMDDAVPTCLAGWSSKITKLKGRIMPSASTYGK